MFINHPNGLYGPYAPVGQNNLLPMDAYNWTDAIPFHCPANIDHHCSAAQERGYQFEDCEDGTFVKYGDNRFSGFVVSSGLVNATSNGGAFVAQHRVVGALHNSPSMFAASDRMFSVKNVRGRTTCEVPVELVYQTPDGSQCTDSHVGTLEWSDIVNTRYGGTSYIINTVPISHTADLPSICP